MKKLMFLFMLPLACSARDASSVKCFDAVYYVPMDGVQEPYCDHPNHVASFRRSSIDGWIRIICTCE